MSTYFHKYTFSVHQILVLLHNRFRNRRCCSLAQRQKHHLNLHNELCRLFFVQLRIAKVNRKHDRIRTAPALARHHGVARAVHAGVAVQHLDGQAAVIRKRRQSRRRADRLRLDGRIARERRRRFLNRRIKTCRHHRHNGVVIPENVLQFANLMLIGGGDHKRRFGAQMPLGFRQRILLLSIRRADTLRAHVQQRIQFRLREGATLARALQLNELALFRS